MDGHGAINDTARALFAPLGDDYDRWAAILSFAQDPRWRRFLVEHVPVGPDARVLDVATGTGAIARALVRRYGCRVVGVDQSPQMLEGARERIDKRRPCRAHRAPPGQRRGARLPRGLLRRAHRRLPAALRRRSAAHGRRSAAPRATGQRPSPCSTSRCRRTSLLAASGMSTRASGFPCSAAWSRPDGPRWDAICAPASRRSTRSTRPVRCARLLIEAGAANVNTRRMSLGGGLVAWGVRAVR